MHRTSAGNLSIKLNAVGSFEPVIEITDSRGQLRTYTLPAIDVVEYSKPTLNFTAERCNSTGIVEEEGAYALITAKFGYFDAGGNCLLKPNYYLDGSSSSNITWYENYNFTSGVSNPVNWSNYAPDSPVTLYGICNNSFSTSRTYTLGLEPKDNYYTGALITKTLNTGFYTLDVGNAGKEVVFGGAANTPSSQVPSNGLFRCDMDANFTGKLDASNIGRNFLNLIYPVGSIYETTKSKSEFDPNTFWGGTWQQIEGRVLVGSGTSDKSYALGGTGGASEVKLSADQSGLPAHTHGTGVDGKAFVVSSETPTEHKVASGTSTTYYYWYTQSSSAAGRHTNTGSNDTQGATSAHENMPPYVVVNIWKRTA